MMPFRHYVRRLPRTLMFWLFIAVVVLFGLRLVFPRSGFDKLDTGDGPLDVAAAADGVWVLNYEEHSVTLVDPNDVGVMFTASVGDEVAPTISADDSGAWVLLDNGTTLALLDPVSEEITDRIDVEGPLDGPAQDLAAGGGWVWVTSGASGLMAQVDAESGEVAQTLDIGQSIVQPQVVGDVLWVVRSDGLGEYDLDTGDELRVIESDRTIRGYAVGEDAIWLLTDIDGELEQGTVVTVDLASGQQTTEVVVGGTRPSGMVLVDDRLVVTGSGGMMVLVATDPLQPEAAEQVALENAIIRGAVYWEDRVWAADSIDGVVYQSVDDIQGEATTGTTVP
jgi:hypothetical protein